MILSLAAAVPESSAMAIQMKTVDNASLFFIFAPPFLFQADAGLISQVYQKSQRYRYPWRSPSSVVVPKLFNQMPRI
jgi:hypothetical protein